MKAFSHVSHKTVPPRRGCSRNGFFIACSSRKGDMNINWNTCKLHGDCCIDRDRKKVGAARYEFVRTLPPMRFAELYRENLRGKLSFDEIIDRERLKTPNAEFSGSRGILRESALSAGFDSAMRRAVAAAVRTSDGLVHFMPAPCRHHHTVHALHRDNGGLIVALGEQGFVMSDGTFANREEAGRCAIEAGQIKALAHPPKLYSEDLW